MHGVYKSMPLVTVVDHSGRSQKHAYYSISLHAVADILCARP